MRMAAIYARVSSEQQREENTIESRRQLIELLGARYGSTRRVGFEDEGYSGATLERPA